ncbi:MCE family protein [Nocardia fluminea]|uniref:Virulence factor Mce-like protein n=1 Tax=Nocardia fluminea TaxID=134984 RepID=A0A2N3VKJ5_9NOCA|nr:MCE family protein [Nocardia fluminea]PKV82133.1 virulence factor Mce-like protein [Nocardia fluminea]
MTRLLTLARIALVLALGALAGCAGSPDKAKSITITARFDNGAGLYVGNAVAVLGMPVGEVTAITPRGSHVEVTLRVEGDVDIPADATAVTVSTSVLTDRHVEFTPPYRGGATLADGAQLDLDRTRTPIDFDRLLGAADGMAAQLAGASPDTGPIARLLDVSAQIAAGSGPELRATMNELSGALRLGADGGAQTKAAITTIVDHLAVLIRAAAENDATIREFGSATGQLSDVLEQLEIGAGGTGAQIVQIMQQTDDLLTQNSERLRATVSSAGTVTRALADYREEVAEFIDVTPLLLNNAYNAIDVDYRGVRVHALLDKVFFDAQLVKEVCNVLGLRQLGCNTGTLQDFGPDFGITDMLEAMSRLPR